MTRASSRSGQIVLVLLFVVLGLLFLFLLGTDIFAGARGKTRLQNAGDAAALAAARWQGITLNLIGELNLLHLAAGCETNREAIAGICALQERLALAGPALALLAANETARENLWKITPADSFAYVEMNAMRRIVEYAANAATERTSPTWPDKGGDYAAMLRTAVADGCWAGTDNAQILPAVTVSGSHPLYSKTFYDAADSKNWPRICIHVFGGDHGKAVSTLLNWPGWGNIPEASCSNNVINSEFFGVGVQPGFFTEDAAQNGIDTLVDAAVSCGLDAALVTRANIEDFNVLREPFPWYFYECNSWGDMWRTWHELDLGGAARFPLRSPVKPEYNVKGAAAACRVVGELVPVSETSLTNLFAWTACAKPFGDWRGKRVIDLFSTWDGAFNAALVLPSFTFVRLIPLGGVGENSLGTADEAWLRHVREHVPNNLRVAGCRYCSILVKWDDPAYTREGGEYLQAHAHDEVCAPPTQGTGPGGGTRHAH